MIGSDQDYEATAPKPMDPARLAHLRGLLDPLCFTSAVQG